MSARAALFVAGLLMVSSALGKDPLEAKIDNLDQANLVFSRLTALARQCYSGLCIRSDSSEYDDIRVRVESALADTSDPAVLHLLAVFAITSAGTQTAGGERVDLVFDAAWTESIRRIGEAKDRRQALNRLETIARELRLDGAAALLVHETKAKVQRELKGER